MIDGNTSALNAYERRIQNFEHIESMFNTEIEPILDDIQQLVYKIKNLVTHYEDEYGFDFMDEAMSLIDSTK